MPGLPGRECLMVIKFRVDGEPAQKGSMSAFPIMNKNTGKPVLNDKGIPMINVTDNSKKTKPWQRQVALEAQKNRPEKLLEGPVVMVLKFYFERPKSVSEKKRPYPIVYPDLDKLIRAIGDALTGKIYSDDAQVVDIISRKRYGEAGVEIEVWEITPETDPDGGPIQGQLF